MDSSDEEATTWYMNFFEHEDFILTFKAIASDIQNHFHNGLFLQSMQNHSRNIHCHSFQASAQWRPK